MLKIHTSDGQTHRLDLTDEAQAREWLPLLARQDFQATLKGITLVERHPCRGKCPQCGTTMSGRDMGVQYSVSRPDDFRSVFFQVEAVEPNGRVKGGERVTVFADDVRLVLMAHASQPATRVTVTRMGKRRFNPQHRQEIVSHDERTDT